MNEDRLTPEPSTTLGQLRDALQAMLDDGVDPGTPVALRMRPQEPNAHTGAPNTAPLRDAWHHPGERTVYLDEPGV